MTEQQKVAVFSSLYLHSQVVAFCAQVLSVGLGDLITTAGLRTYRLREILQHKLMGGSSSTGLPMKGACARR